MPDQGCEVRAGGDIIFRVDGGAAILQLNRPAKRHHPAGTVALPQRRDRKERPSPT
jgi:hypothetical protein